MRWILECLERFWIKLLTLFYCNKQEKIRNIREQHEYNEIRLSIFEKQKFSSRTDIVDFGFIPFSIPSQSNMEHVVVIFAINGITNTTLIIKDFKGEVILNHTIPDCSTKFLLPSLHPHDIFAAVICHNNDFHMLRFSVNLSPNSERPSEDFFRIVERSSLSLPEEISIFLSKSNETLGEHFDVVKVIPYFVKRTVYFILVDNSGRIINLKAGKEIMHIFRLETTQITDIQRHNLNMLFATKNNVGFLKVFEQISDMIFCEIGTARILHVAGDRTRPSEIYALTQENYSNFTSEHLVIFHINSSKQRTSMEGCKIVGKIKLSSDKASSNFTVVPLKGFVAAMDPLGKLSVYKALDLNDMVGERVKYVYKPFKNSHNATSSIPQVLSKKEQLGILNQDVRGIDSYQGSFVLIRNPQNLSEVKLFEFIRINEEEPEGLLDFLDVRILLLILVCTVFYLWRQCKGFYSNIAPLTDEYVGLAEDELHKTDMMRNLKFD
ncbi:unnamed protein product [Moneuplotes crassus]|uniref:Uncharacterized protein n=1 Tax=Euplotes crassus TaxID=5936 RepID=A0AAD1X5L0_EUPCR|nr:unnamed protein product [Moneuplotes crassus]